MQFFEQVFGFSGVGAGVVVEVVPSLIDVVGLEPTEPLGVQTTVPFTVP